jgi:hypothetical protein
MWSVLRRYQNLEGGAAADAAAAGGGPDAFGTNQRTLALHGCRADPAPQDAAALTVPYGALVHEKLLRHMAHDAVQMRRKALMTMLELYQQKQEHAVSSLHAGAVQVYVGLLPDEDEDVRAMACMALQNVAVLPLGQAQILGGKHIPAFLAAVDDASDVVAAEALRLCAALHQAHNECAATTELVRRGAVARYVARAASEDDEVCATALTALGKAFDVKESFIEVLDCHGLRPLTAAVSTRQDPVAIIEASECISKLAFYTAGKRAAITEKTVIPIIELLTHAATAVRTAASGALVALTISEAGKLQAIDADVVGKLRASLDAEVERDILVNEIKVVCNISEHPVARQQLAALIPRLQEIEQLAAEEHPTLVSNAQRAIAMVRWAPGDVY